MMKDHRVLFVDAARTYAIILALGTHALHTFGVPDAGPWIMNYPFFTSMATPMFIFMFGVMMEIVYARRASQTGTSGTDKRLVQRAYQCYLAGALTSVAALVGGIVDLETFFKALVLIERTRYANVLMTYAGALLVMPLILRLRLRYGTPGLLALLLAIIVAVYLISFTKHQDLGYWGLVINRVVGVGIEPDISVLAAFIFILLGMIAGRFIRRDRMLYVFAGVVGSICLTSSLIIWNVASVDDLKNLMTEYAYGRLRDAGDILYFLMGSFYCLTTLSVIKFTVERFPQTHGLVAVLSPLGMHSLLAFAFGNIVLNLWTLVGRGVVPPSLCLILFFMLVWAVCKYTDRLPTYGFWQKLFNLQLLRRYRMEAS